jgi:light-regulated signal transduction histidine kinase (bacteriophytochrome)
MEFVKILTEQNQQLWNFAHIASHNLRSHASNLQMTLELMNNCENEEEKKIFIGPIKKISAAFSQSVINLNKLLFNETDLNKARVPINFKDVLSNVTSALSTQISDTNAIVEFNFTQCPTLEYVPAYLESIILNLVSNAIKYRHPQRAPHIMLHTFIKDDQKILTVKDNGIGIDLKKYTLFSTTQQPVTRHPDSKGLGLIITKNQVESLGGTIDVESEPGIGTTFTINF